MVENTLDDWVGKFGGEELKVIWHCRRKVHRSSRFIPSNVSRAQARIWLAAGAGVCTGGAGGAMFCPSLSNAQMKCRIKSSLVDTGGAFIVARAGIAYGNDGGKLVGGGGGGGGGLVGR